MVDLIAVAIIGTVGALGTNFNEADDPVSCSSLPQRPPRRGAGRVRR